ncbi:hypothetical protein FA15DRAFT_469069 [Coprinopsis marcescibilis]|uniref:Zn(2)-C6 fungal-type domain-containing protein n=1 Tax=Coprinopsis marcescibilis TaxID=230819 RepID=A0A5C3KS92_COPMA|nr:hypothetical protein FA15DRAFT_469069 [Coprinopsis marcescibilis]
MEGNVAPSLFTAASGQAIRDSHFLAIGRDHIVLNVSIETPARPHHLTASPPEDGRSPETIQPRGTHMGLTSPAVMEPAVQEFWGAQIADQAALDRMPAVEGTVLSCGTSMLVEPLQSLDFSKLTRDSSARLHSEVYRNFMYSAGQGYPCFNPRFGCPINIGDVGTIDGDGFRAIFNLKHDGSEPQPFPSTQALFDIMREDEILSEGDTFTPEVEDTIVNYTSDHSFINNFEFHCRSASGAILAITSSADLESICDNNCMRDYLCENAEAIFKHAKSIRGLDHGESLYIVTGCIKTDSWALASHTSPMKGPNNVLVLKNRRFGSSRSFYAWVRKGNAQTRSGTTGNNFTNAGPRRKEHCLFLRGFLLTPTGEDKAGNSASAGNTGPSSRELNYDKDAPSADRSGKGSGISKPGDGSSSASHGSPSSGPTSSASFSSLSSGPVITKPTKPTVQQFPSQQASLDTPSEFVNAYLLQTQDRAQFAVTHDDDWRGTLKGRTWDEGEIVDLLNRLSLSRRVHIKNGVAFTKETDSQDSVVPDPHDVANAWTGSLGRKSESDDRTVDHASSSYSGTAFQSFPNNAYNQESHVSSPADTLAAMARVAKRKRSATPCSVCQTDPADCSCIKGESSSSHASGSNKATISKSIKTRSMRPKSCVPCRVRKIRCDGQLPCINCENAAAYRNISCTYEKGSTIYRRKACDHCRSGKYKCDGADPCNTCQRRGKICTWSEPYPRRRPPSPVPAPLANFLSRSEDQGGSVSETPPPRPTPSPPPSSFLY